MTPMSDAGTPKSAQLQPRIVVIGVGGGGGNAVNNMLAAGLVGPKFVVANTDAQALSISGAEHRIQLGASLTEGIGSGAKLEIGEAAAEEALEEIRAALDGAQMVFIAAGMGGGTGTGAAPVIARVAKEFGILTVAVVTRPFLFEGKRRMRTAEAGIAELRRHVDTLIVIPNQNLFKIADERTPFAEAFVLADQVLYSGVACIVDLVVRDALINLDLADVKTVLSGMGTAMMGAGEASGDERAVTAAKEAIYNPLLDDVSLRGAKSLLLSIGGGQDLTLFEVHDAVDYVRQELDPEVNIIFGATLDDALTGRIRVSIVASGMRRSEPAQERPAHASAQHQGRPSRRSDAIGGRRDAPDREGPVAALRRRFWQGPGDVVIREGPPQLPGQPRLTRDRNVRDGSPGRAERQPSHGGPYSRAAPELEEPRFAGRREAPVEACHDRRQQPRYLDPPRRKPSLLQRLTGAVRDRRTDPRMVGERHAEEAFDLPVFFRREPKN